MWLKEMFTWVEEEYGLRIVTGTFGAWKTKYTFMEAFLRKQENPNWVIISNIPYNDIDWNPLTDILFSSKEDLRLVLRYVFDYLKDTNYPYFLAWQTFVPIKIIIDEAHLYYFSRDFKAFDMEMMTILTQCRKRLITIYFITQELWQIDKFLRRLCPDVIVYNKTWRNLVAKSHMYFISTEKTDMSDEFNVEEISTKTIWRDSRRLYFNKNLKAFFDQKYLTYYICWAENLFDRSKEDFNQFLHNKYWDILLDNSTRYDYEDSDFPDYQSDTQQQLNEDIQVPKVN